MPVRTLPLLLLATLLSTLLATSRPAWAQQSTGATASSVQGVSQGREEPPPPPAVSLDRIKKALAAPPPTLATPPYQGDLPTFRTTVIGHRLLLPDFKETLEPAWQPVAPGMLYHAEFMNMVTPAQARPYGAFTGKELIQVAFTTLVNHYTQVAVKKGVGAARRAIRNERQRRIRKQIEEELAAINEANRKKAAAEK